MESFKEFVQKDELLERSVQEPSKLDIKIDLGNAALNDDGYLAVDELNRIFELIINTMKNKHIAINQKFDLPLKDINGNTIGNATI